MTLSGHSEIPKDHNLFLLRAKNDHTILSMTYNAPQFTFFRISLSVTCQTTMRWSSDQKRIQKIPRRWVGFFQRNHWMSRPWSNVVQAGRIILSFSRVPFGVQTTFSFLRKKWVFLNRVGRNVVMSNCGRIEAISRSEHPWRNERGEFVHGFAHFLSTFLQASGLGGGDPQLVLQAIDF